MADFQSRKNRVPFLLNYSCAIRKARYGNVTYAASISVRINQTTELYEILKAYRARCDGHSKVICTTCISSIPSYARRIELRAQCYTYSLEARGNPFC